MEKGILKIDGGAARKIDADGAVLQCSVRGSSFNTGSAALKKTREVALLVHDMALYGVLEHAFEVQSVQAESGGSISRASSALYVINISCDNLDNISEVISCITSHRSAELQRVKWHYPNTVPSVIWEEMLHECVSNANRRAHSIARELNVQLMGVRLFTKHESFRDLEPRDSNSEGRALSATTSLTDDELGLRISHTKEFFLNVSIEYLIAPHDAHES